MGTNDTTSILASKDPAEIGQPGTEAELAAIRDGTVSFGREHGAVLVTMPLHDRNGDYIAAVRFKLKSFFGETQDNAVGRATLLLKLMQKSSALSAEDLQKYKSGEARKAETGHSGPSAFSTAAGHRTPAGGLVTGGVTVGHFAGFEPPHAAQHHDVAAGGHRQARTRIEIVIDLARHRGAVRG